MKRSTLLVVLAFLVSLGLTAGATVALVNAGDDDKTASGVTTPGDAPLDFGASPTPSPSQTPTETPSATPSATASPSPSATPSASPSATPSASPSTTPSVSPSPSATRSSGQVYAFPGPTQAYAGLKVTAALNDASSDSNKVGYQLRVRASDGDGKVVLRRITWGDGATYAVEASPSPSCAGTPSPTSRPPAYSPEPTSLDKTLGHAFRRAGTFTITVLVDSAGSPCKPRHAGAESRSVTVKVTVNEPETATNGPARPTISKASYVVASNGRTITLKADPYDTDGFVKRIVVSFGDGTSAVVRDRSLSGCDDDGGTTYPGSQPGERVESFSHTYARAGSFQVTFTITSTGCTGADPDTYATSVPVSL